MRFLKIPDEGTKLKGGHYQIPLPFKQENVRLPCNKYQALQRLFYLKRNMARLRSSKLIISDLWTISSQKVTQGSQQ